MHRIPGNMRNYIPYYFVQKMKSNTAVTITGDVRTDYRAIKEKR